MNDATDKFHERLFMNRMVCIFLAGVLFMFLMISNGFARPADSKQNGLNFRVPLANTTALRASDVLRTSLTAYQHELIYDYIWDKFMTEQRVGDVLIDPKSVVILPSKDLNDLKGRMRQLDDLVMDVVSSGGRILINFQAIPRWLSSDPRNEKRLLGNQEEKIWYSVPPTDYSRWQEIIKAFVHHFNKELDTKGRVYYIIGNEPVNYWKGSERDFFKYYQYAVKGSLEADPAVRIGGITPPSYLSNKFTTTGKFTENKKPILYNWIKFCKENNLPIHFVTRHSYPAGSPVPGNLTIWSREDEDIKKWLAEFGFNNIELILTDWPEWKIHPENDTEFKSSWIANSLISLIENGIFRATYLLRDTGIDKESASRNGSFGGGNGLFTKAGVIKPVYNTFSLFSKMEGKIVFVDTQDKFVKAVATVEGDKRVYILLSNFIPSEWLMPRNLFNKDIDIERMGEEIERSGLKKKEAERLMKRVMDGEVEIDTLSFSREFKSYLRGLRDLNREAKERRGERINVNMDISGTIPGMWDYEEYIVDMDHSNSFRYRKDIQSILSPYYDSKDLNAIRKVVQEINNRPGIKLERSTTSQVNIKGGDYNLNTGLDPYAVHLIILTRR